VGRRPSGRIVKVSNIWTSVTIADRAVLWAAAPWRRNRGSLGARIRHRRAGVHLFLLILGIDQGPSTARIKTERLLLCTCPVTRIGADVPTRSRRRPCVFGMVLTLIAASGCAPSHIIGPLRRDLDERVRLVTRARETGVSPEVLNAVVPPLTPAEERSMQEENASCRSSYIWKNGLMWTGATLVAVAAGSTIVGALATGNSDTTGKLVFGIGAGSLAALGTILQVIGGVIQVGFSDRGCVVR
jgi:hypothetical protein